MKPPLDTMKEKKLDWHNTVEDPISLTFSPIVFFACDLQIFIRTIKNNSVRKSLTQFEI